MATPIQDNSPNRAKEYESSLFGDTLRIADSIEPWEPPGRTYSSNDVPKWETLRVHAKYSANAAIDLREKWQASNRRIAELEAIVDKLPKMADGVPLVPGMRAYGSFRDGVEAGTVYQWTSRSRVMFIPQNYSSDDPHLIHSPAGTFMMAATSAIYSTREAAEAAKD
jgi:hypothetical protein